MTQHQNLLITGGWAHPFGSAAPRLREILDSVPGVPIRSTVVWDLPDALKALQSQKFDLVTVFACWFTMRDPRYSPAQRTEWAREISGELRELLLEHRDRGGPLFAVHTATICFDDWPEWGKWLGGRWNWAESHHPPLGDVSVRIVAPHPIVAGVGDFVVVDECYSRLSLEPGNTRLAEGRTAQHESPECLLWCKEQGGRVVYSALGHADASLASPAHQRVIQQAVTWLVNDAPIVDAVEQ
jgi:type 1 glutamine amidotransferase